MVPYDFQKEVEKSKGLSPSPPEEEKNERLGRVRQSLENYDLDGVLLYGSGAHPDPIRHVANYLNPYLYATSLLLIPRVGSPVLVLDQQWHQEEAETMSWIEDIRFAPSYLSHDRETIASVLSTAIKDSGLGSGRIGVYETNLPTPLFRILRDSLSGVEFTTHGAELWVDYVTSPSEYDAEMIKKTAAIADEGLRAIKAACQAGVTEWEVCLKAYEKMAALGAEFILESASSTHVNIGSHAEAASNVRPFLFTNNRLEYGQMFWLDLIVQYDGYYIDCDRTFCIGEPSDEQRELYGLVREMYDAMVGTLRPGVSGEAIWNEGFEIAKEAGHDDKVNFIHVGHTTGPTIAAPPSAEPGVEWKVQPDSFYNVEPGLFVPGVGSACIENTFYVTENGVDVINDMEPKLHVC